MTGATARGDAGDDRALAARTAGFDTNTGRQGRAAAYVQNIARAVEQVEEAHACLRQSR